MSKLTEADLSRNDSLTGRAVLFINSVVDALDDLAASVADQDAKGKVYALADDIEASKPGIVAKLIVGTPAQPPAEPPAPVAHMTPTVSKEAADHAAHAAVSANARKRAERPKDAEGDPIKADNRRQWDRQDELREQEEQGRLDEAAQRRPKSGESIADQRGQQT